MQENVAKTYKKAPQKVESLVNLEAKNIAKSYNIDDCVECLANSEALITLKDHKDNFCSHPTCRLLNPCKSELGKISKCILEEVNNTIKTTLNLNQWKSKNEKGSFKKYVRCTGERGVLKKQTNSLKQTYVEEGAGYM